MSLPKYRNPPVVEVALSVQFQRPEGLSVAHLGLAWDKFKTRFPKIEQHAPLPPAFERRGQPVARPKLQIQLSSMEEEMPRIWMVSDDSHQLLQFQADRFIRNWRRYHNDREPYPSWDGLICAEFIKDYTEFCKFMNANYCSDTCFFYFKLKIPGK